MKTRLLLTGLLAAVIFAACIAVHSPSTHQGLSISPAYASPDATARAATIGGMQVGEVLVDGQVVLRIRTSAGGLSPYQRAQIVAQRIEQLMGNSFQPEDITTGRVNGQEVVMAQGQVIVTADTNHARLNGTTPMALANLWARQFENAVAGRPVTETPIAEKLVPIISVGSGTRVGGALVSGSRDRLDDVTAVAQIEGDFGDSVRARVMVPVSSENVVEEISRVPETSVTGLVDIRL